MRIEILVDNEDPQIFPLNKPKLIIGSQDTCDIVLNAHGISRKHLIILSEDDSFFVVDQGSTNGSYINEERLVPGRRVEFTSFFPVRLGDNVLVTLLSDEDANDLGFSNPESSAPKRISSSKVSDVNDEATRTISLKDLQSAKTEHLVQKRQATVTKRKVQGRQPPKPKMPDQRRMRMVQALCLFILAGAIYYNFYVIEPEKSEVVAPVQKIDRVVKKPEPPKHSLVDKMDMTEKAKFPDIALNPKCVNDIEKYICTKLSFVPVSVVQIGTMLYVFADGDKYYLRAKENVIAPKPFDDGTIAPAKLETYDNDLMLVTAILFVEQLPKDFDYEKLKGLNLTIALKVDIDRNDYATIAITPDSLKKLSQGIQPKNLEFLKKYGAEAFYFMKDLFRIDYSKYDGPPGTDKTPLEPGV